MMLKLLVDGGDMKPGPVVGQQLGPVGLNIGEVIKKVNEATRDFKGMKVPVSLEIDTKTKAFAVSVSSPPTIELLKKEAGIEKGSGESKKIKSGNISIEQVISIAKTKSQGMFVSDFKAAVKSVVGTCACLGLLIESKEPKKIQKEIDEGKYAGEITNRKTETDPEKKKSLDEYFAVIKERQDAILKKEQESKAEEEAKKAERSAKEAKSEKTAPTEKKETKSPKK